MGHLRRSSNDWVKSKRSVSRPTLRLVGMSTLLSVVILGGSAGLSRATDVTGRAKLHSNASGVSTATANVDKYLGTASFVASGPAFNAKTAKGKKVWLIDLNSSIPFNKVLDDGIKSALAKAGVVVTACDAQGTLAGDTSCSDEAVASHPSLIIDQSIDPGLISSQMKKAIKKGISVIEGNIHDPTSRLDLTPGAVGGVAYPFSTVGRLMADWAIKSTDGHAHVLIVESSDVTNARDLVYGGIEPELHSLCAACTYTLLNVPVANWATDMTSSVQAELVAHPSINYILPIYDSMATYVDPAVSAAHATSRVKEVSFNADLAELQLVAANQYMAADVGISVPWQGWAYADQALRVLTGHKPVVEQVPIRIFIRSNTRPLSLTNGAQDSGAWYGSVNFKAAYLRLWGLG